VLGAEQPAEPAPAQPAAPAGPAEGTTIDPATGMPVADWNAIRGAATARPGILNTIDEALAQQPSAPPAPPAAPAAAPGTTIDKASGAPLANLDAIWQTATSRPAVVSTIEQAIAQSTGISRAEKVDAIMLAREMEADPKAILDFKQFVAARPALLQTVEKVAAENAKLGGTTAATSAPAATPAATPADASSAAPAPATPAAAALADLPPSPTTDKAAAFEAAERAAQQQRDREIDALRRDAVETRYEQELARAEAAGSGLQPGHQTTMEAALGGAKILGKDAGSLSDGSLKLLSEKGAPEARAAARAEIARREEQRRAADAMANEGGRPLYSQAAAFERLRAQHSRADGVTGEESVPMNLVPRERAPRWAQRAADLLAGAFGKQVVFVDADPKKYEGSMFMDDPGTVYVNVNANRSVRRVIGHELLHTLRRTNPDVYKRLLKAVSRAVDPKAAGERYSKVYADYVSRFGTEKGVDLQVEEMVADIFGDQMDNPRFWYDVYRAMGEGRAKSLMRAIGVALDAMRMKLRVGAKGGYDTAAFVTNIEAVRKASASAYAEWTKDGSPALTAAEAAALESRADGAAPGPSSDGLKKFAERLKGEVKEKTAGIHADVAIFRAQGRYKYDKGDIVMGSNGRSWEIVTQYATHEGSSRGPIVPAYILKSTDGEVTRTSVMADPWKNFRGERRPGFHETSSLLVRAGTKESLDSKPGRRDVTETPEFKKWFGDSKVVDAEGRPLVVYHGTHSDITAFSKRFAGSNTPNSGMYGTAPGYFTASASHASGYAEGPTHRQPMHEGANVMPVYLSIKNPFVVDSGVLDGAVRKLAGRNGDALVAQLKDAGYDGVIVSNTRDQQGDAGKFFEVIPFSSEQIKSATGNRGTFDAGDDNILHSRPSFSKFAKGLPRDEEGNIVGSGGRDTRSLWNLVQRLEADAREGERGRAWYRESAKEILKAFNGDVRSAERFAQLIAITSAHTEVRPNFTAAEKALIQFAAGEPIHVGVKMVDQKVNDLLYFGVEWEGRKTNNFYNTIMAEITGQKSGETVVDMHHARDIVGHTSPSPAEYAFIDSVFKHVAKRMRWPAHETQAAIWVATKARYLLDKYKARGWHSSKSEAAKREMALAEAGIHYGDIARARWSMFGPDVKSFESSEETQARGVKVTAEVKPTTKLDIGKAVAHLSMTKAQEYQKDALRSVFGAKGVDAFFEAMGLDRTQYRVVEGAGGYEGMTAPNAVVTLNVDADTAERVAKAWMYIFRQDAVPFFRADAKLIDDANAAQGVLIEFKDKLTNPKLREAFDALRAEVDPGIGFTRVSEREIAVINFRGDDGKPFLMDDAAFYNRLDDALDRGVLAAKIASRSRFGAETRYPYHDWQEDNSGQGLLPAAAGGSPAVQQRLRRWADVFGRFAEGRAEDARRAGGELRSAPAVDRGRDSGGTQEDARAGVRDGRAVDGRGDSARAGGQAEGQRLAEGYAGNAAEGTPRISVRPRHPDAVTVVGYHYGADTNELHGERFGTGAPSAESRGVAIKKRIYFYPQRTPGAMPESERVVTGEHVSRAVLTNLYDTWVDPVIAKATKDLHGGAFNFNTFERLVVEAGYDGYISRGRPPDGGVVLLNVDRVPVEPLGKRADAAKIVERMDSRPAVVDDVAVAARGHAATEGQRSAGNYEKAHVKVGGLDISIENRAGTKRRPEWPTLNAHYGYIKRTEDRTGEHIDVFVKPGTPLDYKGDVFVVDTNTQSNRPDEYKVLVGWDDLRAAKKDFLANYTKDWNGLHAITRFDSMDEFKAWLANGDTKRRVEGQALDSRSTVTSTPEFKRWFGDSKVVDAEGRPLVVYHGTGDDFGAFKVWSHFGSTGAANERAMLPSNERRNANVMPVYLSIKNPLRIKDVDADPSRFIAAWAGGKMPELGPLPKELSVSGRRERYAAWNNSTDSLVRFLEERGYDGLVYQNEIEDAGHESWVAFRPSQVKSVFNRGSFDAGSDNALDSRARAVDVPMSVDDLTDLDFTDPNSDFVSNPSPFEAQYLPFDDELGNEGPYTITWAQQPRNGTWISETADGRYQIVPDNGYYMAEVDGREVSSHRTRRAAIQALNQRLQKDIAAGTVRDPFAAKLVTLQYERDAVERVVSGWERIAKIPSIFRNRFSVSKKLADVIQAFDKQNRLVSVDVAQADQEGMQYEIKFKSMPGDDKTISAFLHVSHVHKEAYLDISAADKGTQAGSFIYPAVFNWVKNNDYKLVPDPNGLSNINTYRRTEQMISATLKLGGTDFMRPHPDQRLYGWVDDVKSRNDHEKNVAIMLITSMRSVQEKIPKVKDYEFDFDRMRFTKNGYVVPAKEIQAFATERVRYNYGMGPATIARAIITQSLIDNPQALKEMNASKALPSILTKPEEVAPLALYSQPAGAEGDRPGAAKRAALGAARAAVTAGRPVGMALDLTNRVMDLAAQIPGRVVLPITSRAYDRVTAWNRDFWKGGEIRQQIAHGMVADYGLPEPYLERRDDREIEIQKVLRRSKEVVDRIASLDHAESRVAYLWMNEKPDTAEEQRLLAMLPAESRATLAEMKQMIDDLGQEAVRLGLLSQESYERNHMAYLHRSYKKYEVENPQAVASSARAKALRAETYRGRGLRDDVSLERVPGAQRGDHYVRLEKRKGGTAEKLGMLERVVYIAAGHPIPPAYAGWRNDGVWEARFTDREGSVGMWRDLTPDERQRLGEIEEVRYAFARTMIAQIQDIETAKFLAWVGANYSVADEAAVAEKGGVVADTSDSMVTLKTYADNEWVQVPGTVAQGTRLYKYGAIQSRYIPGHIWNDIRATINSRSSSNVWRLYDELLKGWKVAKTALSPAVHTNNVMSNFILADLAEVSHKNLAQALRTMIDAEAGNETARAVLTRYLDSGAELGTPALHELRREVIEPILAKLQGEESETLASLSLIQALALAARGNVRQALAGASNWKMSKAAKWPFEVMMSAYGLEDSVFRFAKWLKETDGGKDDRTAAKEARAAFLDYRINAPWIQALRRGPFPFLAFTYRVVPILADAAANKPWKLMKYAAAGYAVNALAYAMLGLGGSDEDKERALLPDEKQGVTILGTPRLVRMPWNDEHGSPVFLDIRRWIPGGDLIDVNGSHSAIPLPQWLSLGGFFGLGMEMMSNKNSFTGKEIWKESDTIAERTSKVFDHLFRFMAPNVPLPNPLGYALDAAVVENGMLQTYSWRAIQAADTGVTDDFGREKSLPQSVASAVGVKLSAYPEDQLRRNLIQKRDAELRDNSETTSRYKREARRGGLTMEELEARLKKQNDKAQEIRERYGKRISQP